MRHCWTGNAMAVGMIHSTCSVANPGGKWFSANTAMWEKAWSRKNNNSILSTLSICSLYSVNLLKKYSDFLSFYFKNICENICELIYQAFSRGNPVLRHLCPYVPPNFRDISCGVAGINSALFTRAKKHKNLFPYKNRTGAFKISY